MSLWPLGLKSIPSHCMHPAYEYENGTLSDILYVENMNNTRNDTRATQTLMDVPNIPLDYSEYQQSTGHLGFPISCLLWLLLCRRAGK